MSHFMMNRTIERTKFVHVNWNITIFFAENHVGKLIMVHGRTKEMKIQCVLRTKGEVIVGIFTFILSFLFVYLRESSKAKD